VFEISAGKDELKVKLLKIM